MTSITTNCIITSDMLCSYDHFQTHCRCVRKPNIEGIGTEGHGVTPCHIVHAAPRTATRTTNKIYTHGSAHSRPLSTHSVRFRRITMFRCCFSLIQCILGWCHPLHVTPSILRMWRSTLFFQQVLTRLVYSGLVSPPPHPSHAAHHADFPPPLLPLFTYSQSLSGSRHSLQTLRTRHIRLLFLLLFAHSRCVLGLLRSRHPSHAKEFINAPSPTLAKKLTSACRMRRCSPILSVCWTGVIPSARRTGIYTCPFLPPSPQSRSSQCARTDRWFMRAAILYINLTSKALGYAYHPPPLTH